MHAAGDHKSRLPSACACTHQVAVYGILCVLRMLQVITGADFHPSSCNLFAFSSSKGSIRVADMRSSALCDKQARSYEEAQATVS